MATLTKMTLFFPFTTEYIYTYDITYRELVSAVGFVSKYKNTTKSGVFAPSLTKFQNKVLKYFKPLT